MFPDLYQHFYYSSGFYTALCNSYLHVQCISVNARTEKQQSEGIEVQHQWVIK